MVQNVEKCLSHFVCIQIFQLLSNLSNVWYCVCAWLLTCVLWPWAQATRFAFCNSLSTLVTWNHGFVGRRCSGQVVLDTMPQSTLRTRSGQVVLDTMPQSTLRTPRGKARLSHARGRCFLRNCEIRMHIWSVLSFSEIVQHMRAFCIWVVQVWVCSGKHGMGVPD